MTKIFDLQADRLRLPGLADELQPLRTRRIWLKSERSAAVDYIKEVAWNPEGTAFASPVGSRVRVTHFDPVAASLASASGKSGCGDAEAASVMLDGHDRAVLTTR